MCCFGKRERVTSLVTPGCHLRRNDTGTLTDQTTGYLQSDMRVPMYVHMWCLTYIGPVMQYCTHA